MEAIKSDLIQSSLHAAQQGDPLGLKFADFIANNVIVTTEYDCLKDINFVVTCYGAERPINLECRDDTLPQNSKITTEIACKIKQHINQDAFIINTVNPVDVITWQVQELSGLPVNQVIGLSGLVDITRFAYAIYLALSEYDKAFKFEDIDIKSLMVLGEHGNDMTILLESALVKGTPLLSLLKRPESKERIINYTKKGGLEIRSNASMSAHHGPAATILTMLKFLAGKPSNKPLSILASVYNEKYQAYLCSEVTLTDGKLKASISPDIISHHDNSLFEAASKIQQLKRSTNIYVSNKADKIQAPIFAAKQLQNNSIYKSDNDVLQRRAKL